MSAGPTYDPFGEKLESLATSPLGDRRVNRIALAVFWTLAVALTAGRIAVGPGLPAAGEEQVVASAAP